MSARDKILKTYHRRVRELEDRNQHLHRRVIELEAWQQTARLIDRVLADIVDRVRAEAGAVILAPSVTQPALETVSLSDTQ